jgi:hypothetical protein
MINCGPFVSALDWAPSLENRILVERVVVSESSYIAPCKGTAFEDEGDKELLMWEEHLTERGHVVWARRGPSRVIVSTKHLRESKCS